jgi:universal stress protein A
MKTSTIVCPIDFSPPSRLAFDEACALAEEHGARLLLVHVHHLLMLAMPEMPVLPVDVIQRGVAELEKQLARMREVAVERGLKNVETFLVEGPTWDRIVELARSEACDLIVIGTHGRTGLRHAFLGSVAEKVIRHAPCSVLVVREAAKRS